MIEAVIFDMDGVMIDSVAAAYRARAKVLQEHGVNIEHVPDPHNEDHKGASTESLLAVVMQHTGVVLDHLEYSEKVRYQLLDDLESSGVIIDPGLNRLLEGCKRNAIPLAVATSASRQSTDRKLRLLGIDTCFKLILTKEDVPYHKPNPAIYLAVAKGLGVNPSNCIVFEDSLAGVEAANAAGCRVVGFTKYRHQNAPLSNTVLNIASWDDVSYSKLSRLV